MSHTKGEWRATPINTVVSGEKGRQIAIMQRCGRPQKEVTANARLIAAAPDLLEACENLLSSIGPKGYFPSAGYTRTEALRVAIAKARKEG